MCATDALGSHTLSCFLLTGRLYHLCSTFWGFSHCTLHSLVGLEGPVSLEVHTGCNHLSAWLFPYLILDIIAGRGDNGRSTFGLSQVCIVLETAHVTLRLGLSPWSVREKGKLGKKLNDSVTRSAPPASFCTITPSRSHSPPFSDIQPHCQLFRAHRCPRRQDSVLPRNTPCSYPP
jgi:hypothetical protein